MYTCKIEATDGQHGQHHQRSMVLRPYQQEAVDACLRAISQGEHPVVALPTGSGKSAVIAALCAQIPGRVLVATHRQELLEQDAANLLRFMGTVDHGIYSAGLGRREVASRIVFGGVQSIHSRMEELQQYGAFSAVICDEAHLCPSLGANDTSMYARVFRACPSAARIGLTATPYRLDSGPLHQGKGVWFTSMPIHVTISELTPEYLAPLVGVLTTNEIDVSHVRTRAGEFVSNELSQVACEMDAVRGAVDELVYMAQKRHKWLIFCVDVEHTKLVTRELQARGIDARYVVGTTEKDERRAVFEAYRRGEFRALLGCEVMTTGFDVPDVDNVTLLRPTQSKGLLVQMLGRGTRKAEVKLNCQVLDFAGNLSRHKPLDGLPDLKKTPARKAADAEREAEQQRQAERDAKHDRHASLENPFDDENAATGPQTYTVSKVTYKAVPVRRFPGREMVLASYVCPDRAGGRSVPTWVCLEHDGWARTQAASWFARRGMPMPATAQEAVRQLYAHRGPEVQAIVVREDAQFPQIVVEQFWEQLGMEMGMEDRVY